MREVDREIQPPPGILLRKYSVSPLEAQHVSDGDTIEMTADSPRGQDSRIDKFVDRFATELPAAAQLRHRQPSGLKRYRARRRRVYCLARR